MPFAPFIPQPAPPQLGYANLSLAVAEIWPAINASGPDDAVYWTADELYQWMDEQSKRLARSTGLFVERDETQSSVTGQGAYPLSASHIATIQLDLAGRTLRARNVQEIEALDADWINTADTPKSFVMDTQGFDVVTLYPKPIVDEETLGMVNAVSLPEITEAAAFLPVCPCMRECFTFAALAGALSKESPASKDEVVPWLRSLVGLYEEAASGLWGI